ncbi:MAG: hypothetical protein FWG15_01330 [Propionibacteriaceae bacterium]|nr:hypothetical protein [Propionibacteriaceae bacterium]
MRLNAPTKIVFYISVALMLIGLILFLFVASLSAVGYWVTLVGGILLAAACVLKGL